MTSRKALNKIKSLENKKINRLLIPIEKDLDKLNRVYDIVEEAIQNELNYYLFKIDYETLDAIKTGILRRVKRELEND